MDLLIKIETKKLVTYNRKDRKDVKEMLKIGKAEI